MVDHAVRAWAKKEAVRHPELLRLGYFGSYARDDWGVGSDLDLLAIVDQASESFERRSLTWDLSHLPVPTEIIVYTDNEWRNLLGKGGKFTHALENEVIWIYVRH
ncbi:MAG: nucleotidyltransferase domain-containing protein [bacterium]